MIEHMTVDDWKACLRMNTPVYMRCVKATPWHEQIERNICDKRAERVQSVMVLNAFLDYRPFNPLTLKYYYPELSERIKRQNRGFVRADPELQSGRAPHDAFSSDWRQTLSDCI